MALADLCAISRRMGLQAQIRSKRIKTKLVEQVLGLLIWATSLSLELRSWLAPLYADLHSPPGCMISAHARLWPAFLSALNAKAVLASPAHGIFMPLGSRVLEYQQTSIRSSSDLPRIVPSPVWVRIPDPAAERACPRQAKLTLNGSFKVFRPIWHARCAAENRAPKRHTR